MALGGAVLSGTVLLGSALALVPATRELAGTVSAWAPVLAFPFLYGGLVRWNRFSTTLADPHDVLNGSAAVLAVMAAGNVVLELAGGPLAAAPWWTTQPLLGQIATEFVLLGTVGPDRSLAVVGALAELGTPVSIDDFGTGYSSLAYLRDLPVAELELDRSFTADLLTDARTEAIVASTVALAHRLGLHVVAEGVEDEATLAHLEHLGCDTSQGYLHSQPVPAADLEEWVQRVPRPAAR